MITTILALLAAANQAGVRFEGDGTRLSGIYVNGACILGEDVRTGGAYLIGSADGSDAQGRSVTSVGAIGGRLKSDNPAKVVPPPFRMTWQRSGTNRVTFAVSVGPVPQDYATISFPFDFGLKSMDKFAFDGDSYSLFCSEADGPVKGSGNLYSFIKPRCEIRDLQNHLIGKVGGASTDAQSKWGEVDGPYATVRVTVTKSQHYQKLVFMNHPGTHNLEFSFGALKKGETASLAGELTVLPKAGPSTWSYDAAPEFNHQIGRAEADGWSVAVGDERERYMCFGPYATEVGAGPRVAAFRIMLDNMTFDDAKILTIDVSDAASQRVLATRDLTRGNFAKGMEYQDFELAFNAPVGSRLEFRTLWHGASYTREKSVVVSKR